MAFNSQSLVKSVKKGSEGALVNCYALAEAGIIGKDSSDLTSIVEGTKCAIVSGDTTALTGTSSSSGTAVTGSGTTFASEIKVGDIIYANSGEYREVTEVTNDTALVVDLAFTTDLSGDTVNKFNSVYHADKVNKIVEHTAYCYFEHSIRKDIDVSDEPQLLSLEN